MLEDVQEVVRWAQEQAEMWLEPLGMRWLHVQGVVRRVERIAQLFDEQEYRYLVAAAYLHDIGYAPALQKTGFHPLDGALYVRAAGQERLAALVAYHSGAMYEAKLRGCSALLAQFQCEQSLVADALTYCDMSANAQGEMVTFAERLADIYARYDTKSVVAQAIRQAEPSLFEAVQRIELRLGS